MEVDRQNVDSYGQSTVAFAFCRLLSFQLLPRLKTIYSQKLYRPETGKADAYATLQQILAKPVDWRAHRVKVGKRCSADATTDDDTLASGFRQQGIALGGDQEV
jgi:TnpA family transposase